MSEHDARDRFGLYRLCVCVTCNGDGRARLPTGNADVLTSKCPECRGEGRVRQELPGCDSPEAVGVALVTLAREGEWEGCQFGLLDREGEVNRKWLVLPWPETARTATAAAKLLRSRRQ